MKGGSAGIQIKTDDTFLLASTVPALLMSDFQINGERLYSPPDQVSASVPKKKSQPEIFFFFITLIQANCGITQRQRTCIPVMGPVRPPTAHHQVAIVCDCYCPSICTIS